MDIRHPSTFTAPLRYEPPKSHRTEQDDHVQSMTGSLIQNAPLKSNNGRSTCATSSTNVLPLNKSNIPLDAIGRHVQNYNKSNLPCTSTYELRPVDQPLPQTSSECYEIGLRAEETLTINSIENVPQYKHVAKEKVTQIP